MTSFSLDPAAVERLRARVGGTRPPATDGTETSGPDGTATSSDAAEAASARADGWLVGDDWPSRARSLGRRLVAPAERRFRAEVERAVARQDSELRREVEELRGELIRTRTAHEAELAALNEQLRGRS